MSPDPDAPVSRPHLENITEAVLDGYTSNCETRLRLGGVEFALRSNSQDLLDRVDEYFSRFSDRDDGGPVRRTVTLDAYERSALDREAPPLSGLSLRDWPREPGKTRRKEEFANLDFGRLIRKVRTEMVFVVGKDTRVAVGPCRRNLNQIVNFLNFQYLNDALQRKHRLCHAAGVVLGNRAVAIAATSGGGKSTLALHLMARGAAFLSNDRVLVRGGSAAGEPVIQRGVPKLPRINPGTILHNPRLLPLLSQTRQDELRSRPRGELWELEEKYDAPLDLFENDQWVAEAPLDAFVVLTWRHDSEEPVRIESTTFGEHPELLDPVMKSGGPFYLGPDFRPTEGAYLPGRDAYLEILREVPVLHFSGSVDFARGVRDVWDRYLAGAPRQRVLVTRAAQLPDAFRVARSRRTPELGPRILFFSGGNALRKVSRRLKLVTHNSVHVITPFDSGGSSAQLRETFRMPSIGDLRNRLLALADETVRGNPAVYDVFSVRLPKQEEPDVLRQRLRAFAEAEDPRMSRVPEGFRQIIRTHLRDMLERYLPEDFDLRGASIGNLVLASGYLSHQRHLGSVLFLFSQLVEARGTVLPVVDDDLHLAARLGSGEVVMGQDRLTGKEHDPLERPIQDLWLTRPAARGPGAGKEEAPGAPVDVEADPDVLRWIETADLICFPVGSFYSSVIANLLPSGVGRAVVEASGPRVFMPNLGRDPELLGHTLADQVRQITEFVRRDVARIDSSPQTGGETSATSPETARSSLAASVRERDVIDFVLVDLRHDLYIPRLDPTVLDEIRAMGIQVIEADLTTGAHTVSTGAMGHGRSGRGVGVDPDRVVELLVSMA